MSTERGCSRIRMRVLKLEESRAAIASVLDLPRPDGGHRCTCWPRYPGTLLPLRQWLMCQSHGMSVDQFDTRAAWLAIELLIP
eukprot:3252708-Rhodomonas_salina.1